MNRQVSRFHTIYIQTLVHMLQFHENSSFEAKNITCDFLHESSFLAIEITKDIFNDDKKCKKVQESGLILFLYFLALWPRRIWSIFTPCVCYLEGISTMWATPYVVKSNSVTHRCLGQF